MGIDPGLRITGYACLEGGNAALPAGLHGSSCVIAEAGVFRLRSAGRSLSARLAELDRDIRSALERLRPDIVAVEGLFAHYRHPATAVVMGHGRGVVLLAVESAGLELVELKPAQIKKSMTGYGQATKAQMQSAVQATFGLDEPPQPADVADAIAIAWCARQRASMTTKLREQV